MERFIDIIKQHPILWNTAMKHYSDSNKKDAIWKKIVKELNNPQIPDIKTAKNEWKKLRDGHRESLKRMKASTSARADSPTNNWKYASSLEFLLPYMKTRTKIGNSSKSQDILSNASSVENPQITLQSDDSNQPILPPKQPIQTKRTAEDASIQDTAKAAETDSKRRCEQKEDKNSVKVDHLKKTRHPLTLFFDSMCETTRTFPDWLQREVKRKIFKILCEAEETYENYVTFQQPPHYCRSSPSSTRSSLRRRRRRHD